MDIKNIYSRPPRKRVANFTAYEKALLAQMIKKTPIVESKLTDGKSLAKKNAAWDFITKQFNCNANVLLKREAITLKRAWLNMKSFRRKARAEQTPNLLRTGDGPHAPSPTPQHEGIRMVKEAAPAIFYGIKNEFDSDGENKQTSESGPIGIPNNADRKSDPQEYTTFEDQNTYETNQIVDAQESTDCTNKTCLAEIKTSEKVHRPTDYIRQEAVIRINHLKKKRDMEMLILKTQLEVEQIKKKSALLDEERNKILLEKAKFELEEVKKSIIV